MRKQERNILILLYHEDQRMKFSERLMLLAILAWILIEIGILMLGKIIIQRLNVDHRL
jgi:hypothetical protein